MGDEAYRLQVVYDLAMRLVGTPYKWGGSSSFDGFDCSGLVQELLKAAGAHPDPKVDFTAQTLYNRLQAQGCAADTRLGALAFYGKDASRITHVAFMMNYCTIVEAGGGDSTTLTVEDAKIRNACVRIRSVFYRRDLVGTLVPAYTHLERGTHD